MIFVETLLSISIAGRCIITYWRFGNWLGTVQCPVCRQMVSLMMRDFAVEETDECSEIVQEINDYNRRFSGQPRPVSCLLKLLDCCITLASKLAKQLVAA